jgi:hypothetical protein
VVEGQTEIGQTTLPRGGQSESGSGSSVGMLNLQPPALLQTEAAANRVERRRAQHADSNWTKARSSGTPK